MLSYEERVVRRAKALCAVAMARCLVKRGDKLRVTKCPGTKRTMTFKRWAGPDSPWMVSKSGIDDYHPVTIDKINGADIDIAAGYHAFMDAAANDIARRDSIRKSVVSIDAYNGVPV